MLEKIEFTLLRDNPDLFTLKNVSPEREADIRKKSPSWFLQTLISSVEFDTDLKGVVVVEDNVIISVTIEPDDG